MHLNVLITICVFVFNLGSSCSDISAPATPVSRTKESVNTNPNPLGEVKTSIPHDPLLDNLLEDVPKEAFQFQKKQKRGGTIDVWWLYDDGGKISNKNYHPPTYSCFF